MKMLKLHPLHPYLKGGGGDPIIKSSAGGRYSVRWRDFMSVPQVCGFRKYSEAQAFAAHLPKDVLDEYDMEQLDCRGETYESMTEWWESLG